MSRSLKIKAMLGLTALCLVSNNPSPATETDPEQNAGTEFALKLFSQQTKSASENVLISPCSAFFALSMTLNGAAGETSEQMASVLGTSSVELQKLNKSNTKNMSSLTAGKGAKLEIANAIFADNQTPFKNTFIDLCRNSYSAEAHNDDFGNPKTLTDINSWCSEKTHGKIPSILNELSKEMRMVILNAIYFKGSWQDPFKKIATVDDKFTLKGGQKCDIKMMHKKEYLNYYKGANFRYVSLPYAGNMQRLYIFLPNPGVNLKVVEGEFTKENWNKWMQNKDGAVIALSLPKFTLNYSTDLKNALWDMGMRQAFTNDADFSNMLTKKTKISKVLQKTFMAVDEEGTEAAAVTAVVGVRAMAHMPQKEIVIEFRVDKPFAVALVDETTQEILFLGSVVHP